MAVNEIEFAAGQKWRTRDGDVVGIEVTNGFTDYPVVGDDGITRTLSGRQWRDCDSDGDLIELMEDDSAPAPKTTPAPITPTLRDEFAKAALLGELNSQGEETGYWTDYSKLAARAYEIADAMLAARGGDK